MSNTRLHFDNSYIREPVDYGCFLLFQAGDCYAKGGFHVPPHRQVCDEISLIISGEGEFILNGVSYPVRAGDMFFCPEASLHEIRSNKLNPVRYYYLAYSANERACEYKIWKRIFAEIHGVSTPLYSGAFALENMFSDFLANFKQELPFKSLYIETGMRQIILTAHKLFSSGKKGAAVYSKAVPDKHQLVYKMVNYIDNNVLNIKKLTDISEYMGFSYSYTAQLFNSIMHVNLSGYYQEKRFEAAIKLLKSGMSVARCAEMLGFDTVHSFSRAFKKRYGASPQNYLRCKND